MLAVVFGGVDLGRALELAAARIERSLLALAGIRARGLLPYYTEGGRWRLVEPLSAEPHSNWTGGFVAGQLWLAARVLRSERLEAEARRVVELLAPRALDSSTHDLGFLFWPSAAYGYLATGEESFRGLALRAARTLAGRLLPAGVIQVLGDLDDPEWRGRTIVDTLPNLALLWWAGQLTAARSHARTAAPVYVRADGSTYHAIRFADDGSVRERSTVQGHAAESTWSRGQAWAIHGFVSAHRAGEGWALEDAERTAGLFWKRLPPGLVPPWDFDAPPGGPTDASAGAIAASALLELGEPWRERALALLGALVECCLNEGESDGLLLGSTYHHPRGQGVGGATAWGDFFLLDALVRAAAPEHRLDLF